jgi:Flp pilus assembly protein CpaB
MKRILQILLSLIAIGAGIGGAWYGRTTYLESVVTVNLPVPQQDIEPYTLLTAEMLAWRSFPRALVAQPGDFATQPEHLTGKLTTSHLVAGLPVPHKLVAIPSEYRLADPNLEVISLPVTPEMAVGGQIKIGDRVNIYHLTAWEAQHGFISEKVVTDTQEFPINQTITEIELIASVPVVQVLSDEGVSETETDEETFPLQILVLAASPDIIQDILAVQASTTVGNNQLWITLAMP